MAIIQGSRVIYTYTQVTQTGAWLEATAVGTVIGKTKRPDGFAGWGFAPLFIVELDPGFVDVCSTLDSFVDSLLTQRQLYSMEWGKIPEFGDVIGALEMTLICLDSPDILEERKRAGVCTKCGDRGFWQGLALICPEHGIFI